jgi:hypothetical protein
MTTQICLVSAQAAANLLPALDPKLKPERIVLVVSSMMKKQAAHLTSVLENTGIAVKQCLLSDEHDYGKTEEELLGLAATLEPSEVSLNITGGTKLMSVAAQSIAAASGWAMFYVDADTDRVSWLEPKDKPGQALTEHLRLRHYLQSYGFEFDAPPQRPQMSREQQALTETLLRQIGSLERPLSILNWLAQQAESRRRLYIELDEQQYDNPSLDALLRNFSDAGALSVENKRLCFSSEADRDFVKGGWLELHVMGVINQLTSELNIRDKAANLEVIDAAKVKNELDLACMARNRLFVIECKTARMDRPEVPKANDTLFKLAENCRRLGGVGARGMLVSYRALREPEKKLAAALGIEIVCGVDINRLPDYIRAWIRPR